MYLNQIVVLILVAKSVYPEQRAPIEPSVLGLHCLPMFSGEGHWGESLNPFPVLNSQKSLPTRSTLLAIFRIIEHQF